MPQMVSLTNCAAVQGAASPLRSIAFIAAVVWQRTLAAVAELGSHPPTPYMKLDMTVQACAGTHALGSVVSATKCGTAVQGATRPLRSTAPITATA